jgi:hypothetical protein
MIMISPMNCILNFIDVGPHAHQQITGKEIVFTLKSLSISPTSQVNNKYKQR